VVTVDFMRSLGIAAFLFAGCSGQGTCELQDGTYRATFVETDGTCGPMGDVAVVLEGVEGPPIFGVSVTTGSARLECAGPVDFTDDLCSVEFSRRCELFNGEGTLLGTLTFRGATTIVDRGRVEGSVTRIDDAADPVDDCISDYNVTITRL